MHRLIWVMTLTAWCGTFGMLSGEQDITITLEEKRIQNLSPAGLDLVFYVTLRNGSSQTYSLTGYTYRFVVNEQEYILMPQQSIEGGLPVGPSSAEMIRLPVRITYEHLFRSISGVHDQTSVACYIMGEMSFSRGRRARGGRPFAFSAEFPIFRIPEMEIDTVKAKALTIGGAELEVDIKITNPNGFSLGVEWLEYDLKIGGHPIKQGRLHVRQSLSASTDHVVSIPLLFNFYEVGQDVHGLLQQADVSCRVNGELHLSTEWHDLALPVDLNRRVPVNR
jgi:LEA14-like dessication related protein